MYMQLNNNTWSVIMWINIEKSPGAKKINTKYYILSWYVTQMYIIS